MNIFDKLKVGIVTQSALEAQNIAYSFAKELPETAVVLLEGNLGAGKTNFVKGIAQALDIQQPITSTSFGVYTLYTGKKMLMHVDAYRIEKQENIENWMLDDFLEAPYVVAVEWPSHIPILKLDLGPVFRLNFWTEKNDFFIKSIH